MPIRRLTSAAFVATLIAIVAFVTSAHAQFPGAGAKIPTLGKKAATAEKPAAPPQMITHCASVDPSLIDKFIKAQEIRDKVYSDEVAKANANKAKADALAKTRGTQMVNTMMDTGQCIDAAKEKDPRMKEARRLEDLVAAANDRGEEAKAEELQKKLDPLNQAIDIDADRKCGGKGISALHDCLERKTAELKKQGLAGPMLQIQAQGECISNPATSGMAGATGPSAEEQAAQNAYNDGMANANEKADKAYEDALGEENGRKKDLFVDCCYGVRHKDPVILSNSSAEFQQAVLAKGSALDKVCK
jgi:hypothetical protein